MVELKCVWAFYFTGESNQKAGFLEGGAKRISSHPQHVKRKQRKGREKCKAWPPSPCQDKCDICLTSLFVFFLEHQEKAAICQALILRNVVSFFGASFLFFGRPKDTLRPVHGPRFGSVVWLFGSQHLIFRDWRSRQFKYGVLGPSGK